MGIGSVPIHLFSPWISAVKIVNDEVWFIRLALSSPLRHLLIPVLLSIYFFFFFFKRIDPFSLKYRKGKNYLWNCTSKYFFNVDDLNSLQSLVLALKKYHQVYQIVRYDFFFHASSEALWLACWYPRCHRCHSLQGNVRSADVEPGKNRCSLGRLKTQRRDPLFEFIIFTNFALIYVFAYSL